MNEEVAVVTGAAHGLGRAYALGLAGEGYAVVVADLADPEPVVDEIEGAGGTALGVGVDVADPDSARELADRTLERFGRIDVPVNPGSRRRPLVPDLPEPGRRPAPRNPARRA